MIIHLSMRNHNRNIYFLGSGLVTSIGSGVPSNLDYIYNRSPSSDNLRLSISKNHEIIPYYRIKDPSFPAEAIRLYSLVDYVILEALSHAGLSVDDLKDMPIFIGSSSMDVIISEEEYRTEVRNGAVRYPIKKSGYGKISDYISDRFSTNRTAYTFNTSCTSSINALLYASQFVRTGKIRRALILGIEVLNEITAFGFFSLKLISRNGIRPFDRRRDGTILGEGCSALIIGDEPGQSRFRLLGGSNTTDTYSVTGADPDGNSASMIMNQSLQTCSLGPSDITAIKAHGTSSNVNDLSEARGIIRVFGQHFPPTSVLKPYIGHTLGACGINELVIVYRSVERGFFPSPEMDFQLDEDLNGFRPMNKATGLDSGNFMLNYYGFGGNNTSVIISNI